MRILVPAPAIFLPAIVALSLALPLRVVRAQDVLYRCESADGISIQGKPCPKGVSQRKIAVQHPPEAAPAASEQAPQPIPAQATASGVPLAPANAIRGPNDPYPLWQCMRADGSTFDSRDGVAGKQWVAKPDASDSDDASANNPDVAPAPAQITTHPKEPKPIVIPYAKTTIASDDDAPPVDATPPPPGAAAGQWVADQCTRLEPQQACERFAARRDALRKQIYAAKPSERATWAPEEQDLTSMLYAACGR